MFKLLFAVVGPCGIWCCQVVAPSLRCQSVPASRLAKESGRAFLGNRNSNMVRGLVLTALNDMHHIWCMLIDMHQTLCMLTALAKMGRLCALHIKTDDTIRKSMFEDTSPSVEPFSAWMEPCFEKQTFCCSEIEIFIRFSDQIGFPVCVVACLFHSAWLNTTVSINKMPLSLIRLKRFDLCVWSNACKPWNAVRDWVSDAISHSKHERRQFFAWDESSGLYSWSIECEREKKIRNQSQKEMENKWWNACNMRHECQKRHGLSHKLYFHSWEEEEGISNPFECFFGFLRRGFREFLPKRKSETWTRLWHPLSPL